MFSFTHLVIVFVIALLVFGPEKLPEIARTIGKALGDFRRASTDFRRVIEQEFAEIERQAREKEELERRRALEASNPAPAIAQEKGAATSTPTGPEVAAAPAGSVANTTVQDSGFVSQEDHSSHDVHPA